METTASVLTHPSAVANPGVATPARPAKLPYLLSPSLDVLMIGGASILLFCISWLAIDKGSSTSQISWAAFYLAFAINNPHFMASYVLLYWDKRAQLLKQPRFLWAAVIAPSLIIAYMIGCVAFASPRFLSYAVNFMYFTVGWHYIKQIYGTIVVTSARRGYYFAPNEAKTLKACLFPVWMLSYLNGNAGVRELMHYGVGYKTLAFPLWVQTLNWGLLVGSAGIIIALVVRKYIREGKLPGPAAITSLAAIYIWYMPSFYHAHFWYMIPFFHSLQYMLFVAAIKKNQYHDEAVLAAPNDPPKQRLTFLQKYWGFVAFIGLSAYLSFKFVPNVLDANVDYDKNMFGKEIWMFAFITFINIHHYFIDNVIWRRDNEMLRKYL